jgi:hypothetical protein
MHIYNSDKYTFDYYELYFVKMSDDNKTMKMMSL